MRKILMNISLLKNIQRVDDRQRERIADEDMYTRVKRYSQRRSNTVNKSQRLSISVTG